MHFRIIKERFASSTIRADEGKQTSLEMAALQAALAAVLGEMSSIKKNVINSISGEEAEDKPDKWHVVVKVVEKMMLSSSSTTFRQKKQKQLFLSQDGVSSADDDKDDT